MPITSKKHIYAQLIDAVKHEAICSTSSIDKDLKEKLAHGGNIDAARVAALADTVREAGLDLKKSYIKKCCYNNNTFYFVT